MRVSWTFADKVKLFRDLVAYKGGSIDTMPEDWSEDSDPDFHVEWLRINKPEVYAYRVANPNGNGVGSPVRVEIGRILEFGIRPGGVNRHRSYDKLTINRSQVHARIESLCAAIEGGWLRSIDLPDFILADWNPSDRAMSSEKVRARVAARQDRV